LADFSLNRRPCASVSFEPKARGCAPARLPPSLLHRPALPAEVTPMHLVRTKLPVVLTVLTALLLSVTSLWADDWKLTGSGTRVKTVAIIDVNVYDISHYMKEFPATKSKQAVIDADVGKKFVWKMRRDVDQEKIQKALKDAFAMNGFADQGKIGRFTGAFSSDLKENARVEIVYDADKKETTVTVGGGGSATIGGVDFMKGVWSIWFGKIDQSKLGDQLISKIP
jgi:Chalcone isomerase-like